MDGALVLVVIVLVLSAGALTVLATARRRDATTGSLSHETRVRDRSLVTTPVAVGSAEVERAGRVRAEETRRRLGGHPPARTEERAVVRWEPVGEEEIGVSRRQFLNRGVLTFVGFSTAVFGGAVLGFLWPSGGGGFGAKVNAGALDDILTQARAKREPFYVPQAKAYIQPYPQGALAAAEHVYAPSIVSNMEQGVTALYQRCPHLGCRVPWCLSSQWFECPCHGSKYNRVGEKTGGPAPRGMDRFVVTIEGGQVVIDTSTVVQGTPIGTNTTNQQQEGPSCV